MEKKIGAFSPATLGLPNLPSAAAVQQFFFGFCALLQITAPNNNQRATAEPV
jgi:hypothetical protein